jgi:hypothetical protein
LPSLISNVGCHMPDAETKLAEASFFLELFEVLELREESLTHSHSQETEASFLFSGVVGAFYAALDQWHKKTGNNKVYQAFKKLHPEIHGSTEQGGWRNLTVHLSHVAISATNFVPTLALDLHVRVGRTKLGQCEDVPFAPVQVHRPEYCVHYRGQEKPVVEFCRQHLAELHGLLSGIH